MLLILFRIENKNAGTSYQLINQFSLFTHVIKNEMQKIELVHF